MRTEAGKVQQSSFGSGASAFQKVIPKKAVDAAFKDSGTVAHSQLEEEGSEEIQFTPIECSTQSQLGKI